MISADSRCSLISWSTHCPAFMRRSCHVAITPWRLRAARWISNSSRIFLSLWEYEKNRLIIFSSPYQDHGLLMLLLTVVLYVKATHGRCGHSSPHPAMFTT